MDAASLEPDRLDAVLATLPPDWAVANWAATASWRGRRRGLRAPAVDR